MGSSTHRTRTKIAGTSTSAPATRRMRLEALVQGQAQVLEMISRRTPLPEILDAIAGWVEAQARDGVLVSLLLLDPEGRHLLHGAAPSLPASYNEAINGLEIGPAAGSCGTAAYRRERVVVEDIATDPLWEDYRGLALRHGLRACWSTPLIGRDDDVLGTFAMYYRQPRLPTADDLQLIGLVSRMAILAIEHKLAEEERERLLAREQQALRQAETERQRLHGLFMEAPAVIAVFRGPQHVFELANPLYMQSIGSGREVLGKPIREALPELAGQGYFELLDRVYLSGESYEGHEVLVRLDRRGEGALEDRFFDFTYQPSRNVAGQVDGILVHAADVTEFVRARRQAEESEERFRTLADNISQFAWMADASGYIFWYNQRWYDYTGATLDEMEGWGWQKVHHPDHVERVVEKISACFASGEVWEDTFPLRGKDGAYRWFLSRAIPIRDSSGRVIRWFGTNTDITAQREIERQKDDFISIASHELKTPVTSLKAYAQMLAQRFRREGDAAAAGMLAKMEVQLNKLTRLIGDLLDDAKIKGGKLELQPTSFDYTALVRESVEAVQRTAARHTIVCELAPDVTLTADRERIGEVVTNLLTNAVKYSPDADRVIVRVVREGGEVVTSVRDFGIGIPAEKQAHVFDRFFRATGEGGHSYPGLGLGLYISAEIVQRHGGCIWVKSEEGRGSIFIFALPLDQPPSPTE